MKKKIIYASLFSALLSPFALVRGEWITIADFDSYQVGWGEEELKAAGWILQDGDYSGFSQCVDGTNDCTGLRAVTAAPYNPTKGSDKAILIRAGDPEESFVANSRNNTAVALPEEIPLGGKGTIYFQWAHEITPGHDFFTLTDIAMVNKGPIIPAGQPVPENYPDFQVLVHVRNDSSFAIYQGTYTPAIIEEGNPDASILEREVWYETWIVFDNQAFDSGDQFGPRYDVYIRGGRFGNEEPFHVVNSNPTYAGMGFTEWFIRTDGNLDVPMRTFNILAQYGNPNNNPRGSGGLWVNELAMFTGELDMQGDCITPDCDEPPTCGTDWHGYPVSDCWADTGDWMGWLYIKHDPWIYSEDIGWFYEGSVEAEGGWIYAIK